MGDGRLRVHGIAVGIFRRVGADESESCRIAPLPVCVVELMSKGNTGRVELLFEGSAPTLKGHCPRYLGSINVNLGFFTCNQKSGLRPIFVNIWHATFANLVVW